VKSNFFSGYSFTGAGPKGAEGVPAAAQQSDLRSSVNREHWLRTAHLLPRNTQRSPSN